jgi:hypothetical protein
MIEGLGWQCPFTLVQIGNAPAIGTDLRVVE